MQRGVINAVSTIQFERNFYVLRNAVINAEIKVTDITTPIAGTGDYTICPPFIFCSRTVMLLIIQKIMWELAYNFVFMAEHKQSGSSGAQFAVRISCHGTDAVQKILNS